MFTLQTIFYLIGSLIDYYYIISTLWSLSDSIDTDPSYMVELIEPWRGPVVDKLYAIVAIINFWLLILAWSFLFAFPGIISFHVAYTIDAWTKAVTNLTESYKQGRSDKKCKYFNYDITYIMKHYDELEKFTSYYVQNGVSTIFMIFYGISGAEQLFQAYLVFQLIFSGADWEDYQLVVLDLMV